MCCVHILVGVNVSVIMCILLWIHVRVCVAPPIVVGSWADGGFLLYTLWYNICTATFLLLSSSILVSISRTLRAQSQPDIHRGTGRPWMHV